MQDNDSERLHISIRNVIGAIFKSIPAPHIDLGSVMTSYIMWKVFSCLMRTLSPVCSVPIWLLPLARRISSEQIKSKCYTRNRSAETNVPFYLSIESSIHTPLLQCWVPNGSAMRHSCRLNINICKYKFNLLLPIVSFICICCMHAPLPMCHAVNDYK